MGRRGHGEGSIFQAADGRWVAEVNLGYVNGKRKRKKLYSKTRREVQQKLAVALRTIEQGLPLAPERQTVGKFMEQWLEDTVKPTVRPRTHASYADLVRLHINPNLGQIRLHELGPQQIQSFLNSKREQGLSTSTVKYLHAVLHRALGQALQWGLVQRNVASLVKPPRVERSEVKPFTPEQARVFLEGIQGHRLEALYSVALSVGLRQGEALGLSWEDVDLDAATIRVRRQLQRLNGEFKLVEPKTSQSRRTIELPAFAVGALREHRVRQIAERLHAGPEWQDWGLVFTTSHGTPLDAKNVTHRFQALLERLQLPRMRFHDLRHACATLLLVQGEHPRVVMEILGHSQFGMTMNTYSHVVPALKREAARRMDSLLTRPEAEGQGAVEPMPPR